MKRRVQKGIGNRGLEARAGKRSGGHVHKDDRELIKAERTPEGESRVRKSQDRWTAEHVHSRKQQTQRRRPRHSLGLEKISPKRFTRIEGQNERKKRVSVETGWARGSMNQRRKVSKNQKGIGFSN